MKQAKILKNSSFLSVFLGILLVSASPAESFVFQDKISTSKSLAHYAMGQIYDLLGQTNMAAMEYEKALQYDEGSYIIHLRLGTNYARLGFLNEAKENLYAVNKLNPEDLQSHYLLALIHSTQRDYEKAAEEYEIILKSFSEAEPQNIEIYGYLGQLYYSQRKYDQAVEQFEKILALEPENPDVMYLLGSLYIEVDQKPRAISILKDSLKINPNHDGSLNTLGYLYIEEKNKLDEALDLIERALKISPNNGAYLDSLGWAYYHKGHYEKALEALIKADAVLKDPVIYDHIGDTYLKLNKVEDALKYWQLSLELLPNQEEVQKKIDEVKGQQASM